MPEKSMKEYVEEHGGYYACAFKSAKKGDQRVLVRAKSAKAARRQMVKMFGLIVGAFVCNPVGP